MVPMMGVRRTTTLVAWQTGMLRFFGAQPRDITRDSVELAMVDYIRSAKPLENGTPWYAIARHMLGLRHGMPGARALAASLE